MEGENRRIKAFKKTKERDWLNVRKSKEGIRRK